MFDMLKASGQAELGLHYLVKAYSYNPNRIETIFRLVEYYCVNKMENISYMYYTLIQDYYENKLYNNGSAENWLFRNISEYVFYLPYYMIIVSQRTGHLETGIKMYEIIFKNAYTKVSQSCIDALFINVQLYLHKINSKEFFRKLVNYADLLEANNIIINKMLLGQYKLRM